MIKRWGLFADLHFQFESRGFATSTLRDSLLEELRKTHLDLMLIAGDIFYKGDTSEEAINQTVDYIHQMADACSCPYDSIIICPGNHDLKRSAPRAQMLAAVIEEGKQNNDRLSTVEYSEIIHDLVCKPFMEICKKINNRTDLDALHYLVQTDFANIIVLNTAVFAGKTYPGQKKADAASEDHNLYIADEKLSEFIRRVRIRNQGDRINLVLAHHGVECFALSEQINLSRALVSMGIDLYLCGHVHKNTLHTLDGTRDVRQLSCGGLFVDSYNEPSYLIGEFDSDLREISFQTYEFVVSGRWAPANHLAEPWDTSGKWAYSPERLSRQENGTVHVPTRIELIQQELDVIAQKYPDLCSYSYIRSIHNFLFSREQDRNFRDTLQRLLKQDVCWGENGNAIGLKDSQTLARDFIAYYSLALYCKRTMKINRPQLCLKNLIRDYGQLFTALPLHNEVLAWYARRTGNLEKAYTCDKAMIESIKLECNAGVYTSFASTVCVGLEKEYYAQTTECSQSLWNTPQQRQDDWEMAKGFMPQIIEAYKQAWETEDAYGKHYFIWGKLLLFSPDLSSLRGADLSARIGEAREKFRAASECEDADAVDYASRTREYENYLSKCNEVENTMRNRAKSLVHFASKQNKRVEITKPNEDVYICDINNQIFLIADGVTRPHEEYEEQGSLAQRCADILCKKVHTYLTDHMQQLRQMPENVIKKALIEGNRAIQAANAGLSKTPFVPCSTLILAVLLENKLYFYSCCDTVGYLVRNGVKIQMTEYFNWYPELIPCKKEMVYSELHNNEAHIGGFAIFNGDPRIQDFLHISYLQLEPGDRIILSSDGLRQYLNAAKGLILAKVSVDQIMESSMCFDSPPYQKYADDKTCIIIDIE